MLKFILIGYLLSTQSVWSQDLARDMDFLETQNTMTTPFNIPIYIDMLGNVSLISNDGVQTSTSINPMGQIQMKMSKSIYSKPIISDSMAFREPEPGNSWVEVKRERLEYGLGAAADLGAYVSVGLAPFKGCRQVMVRRKTSAKEKTKRPVLPDSMEEVLEWRDGDSGSFQRFGGVQMFAGLSVSVVNVISVGLTIQNLWSLNITKVSDNKLIFTLAEEDVNKRKIQTGTSVAKAGLAWFNGKRLTAHFILDPKNEEHKKLYKLAIKGKLDKVQERLPTTAQKIVWKGTERSGYFGIPGTIGRHSQRSEYIMQFDDEEEVLDVKSRRNSGILLPLRNHNKFVYQTDDNMTIFWYSEMNKADQRLLDKYFLRPGRLMGVKGFGSDLPDGTMIGATMSQIGMSFTRKEIDDIGPELLEVILDHFKTRCEELDLSCAKAKKFKKIRKKLVSFLDKKWANYRDDLGFIMTEEPALVNAYLKAINAQKKIYFKFLNQKYQSLEGTAPIEI